MWRKPRESQNHSAALFLCSHPDAIRKSDHIKHNWLLITRLCLMMALWKASAEASCRHHWTAAGPQGLSRERQGWSRSVLRSLPQQLLRRVVARTDGGVSSRRERHSAAPTDSSSRLPASGTPHHGLRQRPAASPAVLRHPEGSRCSQSALASRWPPPHPPSGASSSLLRTAGKGTEEREK